MKIRIGNTILDLYKVEGRLPSRKSQVWKVYHKVWGIPLSMRKPAKEWLSSSEKISDFKRICRRWTDLDFHPNIVPCYYVREIDNVPFFFSEWCEDSTLASIMDDDSIYSGSSDEQKKRLASIAFQSMLGIRYAHEKNIVHGNINPENIVVGIDGTVRITFFGNDSSGDDRYFSKYLAQGQKEGSVCDYPMNDIYSWALTVIEMYCGKLSLQDGTDVAEGVKDIMLRTKVEIPPAFCELLVRCLDKKCENRPTAFEALESMEKFFRELLSDDVAFCRVGTEYSEDIPNALNNKALCYLDMNDPDSAEKCWEKALGYLPFHAVSSYNYSVYLWKNGKKEDLTVNPKHQRIAEELIDEELKNEIRRCYSSRVISRLMEISPLSGFIDLNKTYPDIDYICFSKDSKMLLAASKGGNYLKICEVETGELLLNTSYTVDFPQEYADSFCEPLTSFNDIHLTARKEESESFFGCLTAKGSPRILGKLYCNYQSISDDPNNRFSFSPDGTMIAVPDSQNNGVVVYSVPQNELPKVVFCASEQPEKLLERKRQFSELRERFFDFVNCKEYSKAAETANEMCRLNVNLGECIKLKGMLSPVCRLSQYTPLLRKEIPRGVSQLRISSSGKYFAYRSASLSDRNIWIDTGRSGEGVATPVCVDLPADNDIINFWFDCLDRLCIYHVKREEEEFENAPELITFIDFWNNKRETKQAAIFSGTYKGTDKNGVPVYHRTQTAVVDENLYTEITYTAYRNRTMVPAQLRHICKMEGLTVCDITGDYTLMIAGNDSEIRIYDIDYKIAFDSERAREHNRNLSAETGSDNSAGENSSEPKSQICNTLLNGKKNHNEVHKMPMSKSECNLPGVSGSNRFLLDISNDSVYRSLNLLNGYNLENPQTTVQKRAKQAKEWLETHGNDDGIVPPHPDEAVQHLIDMSDEEYDNFILETKRQGELWHNKPNVSFLTVFLRSLKECKSKMPLIACETRNINGIDEYNSFLIKDFSLYLSELDKLNNLKITNPWITLEKQIEEAKAHIKNGGNSVHSDPVVQHLIEMSDEQFEETLRENIRRSAFWHGSDDESFLCLFVRTQDPEEIQSAENKVRTEYSESLFGDFKHNSASEDRRLNQIPKLTNDIRSLRKSLLENVIGQDHVVHAFCEGIFNSEVLLEADTERVRPLAVFTFAGPPGVGKTYLAEQAAKQLGRPFRRFDMTEYSTHDSHNGLIGFDYTWKNSCPGQLTSYVYDNPNCVLLFDEVEKSHAQVIQVFYQMLDAGIVTDKYYSTKSESDDATEYTINHSRVSFRDTIIIFTTNAGRSLYEGDCADNCASIPTKTLLNALKTEINPLTKEPFFPAAIVSRIATGYPLLFNHLRPHHLVWIIEKEFKRIQKLFKKQYGITIESDKETMLSLLYSEGGAVDARTLRARVELFFKNEFFKICSSEPEGLENIVSYVFRAKIENLPENVNRLFKRNSTPEILVYSDNDFAQNCKKNLNGFVFYSTQNIDEAIEIAGEKDISFAIIDIAQHCYDPEMDSALLNKADPSLSFAVNDWDDGKRLFRTLRTRLPELPIYLLENAAPFSEEIVASFCRIGARGKLTAPHSDEYEKFGVCLNDICLQMYMQSVAADIAAEHKVLFFETTPAIQNERMIVELRNFELRQAPDAGDADDIVNEAEKPKERFDDIIGAESAKKELSFFVNFLKNPKKYAAQGHRMPKGVLLYGKPGTGKTMLARAMAGESDVTFIPTTASSFVTRYTGSGPEAIRELFKKARRYAPSIVFIDEVDSIGKQRTGSKSSHCEEETLNALLTEMDGFSSDSKRPVFILAATNYGVDDTSGIGTLDEAFMRRFDRKIKIELPDTAERKKFLVHMLSKVSNHEVTDNKIDSIASRSIGVSPAILDNIIETAKRMAFDKQTILDDAILEEAYEATKHGDKKEWGKEYILRIAQHECGHALISILGGDTPAYLTIEARGDHGGYMEYPEKKLSAPIKTKEEIIWSIRTALGGRAAEIACYGNNNGLSTGACGDLESATIRTRNMLICYGMDNEFGLATMSADVADKSPEIREKVNKILSEQLEIAIDLINKNRDKLDLLCYHLLQKNRLTGDEIDEIFENATVKN